MIQQTSYSSYLENIVKINYRQYMVLAVIKDMNGCNNMMISKKLKLPINCVTGRVRELVKKGFVEKGFIGICPYTHEKTIYWKVKEYMGNCEDRGEKTTIKKVMIKEVNV